MLSVKELRPLATRLSADAFRKQLGPFVLVQQPPSLFASAPQTQMMGALPVNVRGTVVRPAGKSEASALAMLFQFEDLVVASVPPLKGHDELSVGRQPDNDLVLDDSSVSKRHAVLSWDEQTQRATVRDLGSTNGTTLNGSARIKSELVLRSGDILSFGDMQYWYLLTDTLHEKLRANKRSPRAP